jgi:hypothetical protein
LSPSLAFRGSPEKAPKFPPSIDVGSRGSWPDYEWFSLHFLRISKQVGGISVKKVALEWRTRVIRTTCWHACL